MLHNFPRCNAIRKKIKLEGGQIERSILKSDRLWKGEKVKQLKIIKKYKLIRETFMGNVWDQAFKFNNNLNNSKSRKVNHGQKEKRNGNQQFRLKNQRNGEALPSIEMTVRSVIVWESEICNFDVHVGVEKEIFGFEISMNDPVFVAVVDGLNDLPKLSPGKRFRHSTVASNVF